MFSLVHVSKKYKHGVLALDDISLELPNRGFISLNGENGCGKTTLLNIIATIDKPTSGQISYNDIGYGRKSHRYLRNKVISYIQQENVFANYLTVCENINLTESDNELIEKEFDRFNIADKMKTHSLALSGGQRQKSSFIRGIIKESSVLLVDEPTSNMDKKTEAITFQLLKEISKNKLVIVVSHNMQLIEEYSDMIIHMDCGKITEIVNNQHVNAMRIAEDAIYIPDDPSYGAPSDWVRVLEILRKNKQVVLTLYHCEEGDNDSFDFTIVQTDSKRIKKKSTRRVVKTACKSAIAMPIKTVFTSVFIALLVVASAVAFCLSNINVDRFEYDMFLANGYERINLSPNEDVNVLFATEKPPFTVDTYRELLKKHDPPASILSKLEDASFDIPYNEVYTTSISAFLMIDEKTEYVLLSGRMPTESQVMITDYFADSFIMQSLFQSYEEILERGFDLNSYHFDVSGIIDTDYEDYLSRMSGDDLSSSEEYLDWLFMQENVYTCLYIKSKLGLIQPQSVINMVPVNHGSVFADIYIYDNTSLSPTEECSVYINEELSVALQGETVFKTANGSYLVAGVHSDDLSNPTIYVTYDQFLELRDNVFTFSSFNLVIDEYETYHYVKSFDLQHNTPISSTINKAVEIVNIINGYLLPIIISLMTLTLVLAIVFWTEQNLKDKFTIYTIIMNGYSYWQVYLFSVIKYAVKMIIEVIWSVLFYLIITSGLNDILSSVSSCNMTLLSNDMHSLLFSFSLYAALMFIVVLVYSIRSMVKYPIQLYLASRK